MYEDRKRMINSAFGVLLLPMVEDRYQILNALDVMLKYINVYGMENDSISHPLTGTFWNVEKQAWFYKFADAIIDELRTRSFLRRFSHEDLKPFLSKMTVKQHDF